VIKSLREFESLQVKDQLYNYRTEDHIRECMFTLQQKDRNECLCSVSQWKHHRTLCLLPRLLRRR
nr:hypothetical protein [Tanacetum cinerariifolium]